MNKKSIQQLDLNLLKIFRVIAEEKKTVTAAKRLHMTQPAVSRALARLREHFDDPLFVRTRHGLKTTEKGQLLSDQLPDIMDNLSNLLETLNPFHPASHQATLTMAINPFLGYSLPAELYLKLQQLAPNIKLQVESWNASTADKLITGEIDIGINYHSHDLPKEILRNKLAVDRFQLLARNDHPLIGQCCSAKQIAEYPIASVIVPDWNERSLIFEQAMGQLGCQLDIRFRAESITSLAEVVAKTDSILPSSALLSAKLFPQLSSLQVQAELTTLEEDFSLYTHYRHRSSPYYKWIQELLSGLIKTQAT